MCYPVHSYLVNAIHSLQVPYEQRTSIFVQTSPAHFDWKQFYIDDINKFHSLVRFKLYKLDAVQPKQIAN